MSQIPKQGEARTGRYGQSSPFVDFLTFRTMITPIVIQILFWVMLAVCVIGALVSFGRGTGETILAGIVVLVLGPLFVRIYCELLILLFRIRDLLQEIRDKTGK